MKDKPLARRAMRLNKKGGKKPMNGNDVGNGVWLDKVESEAFPGLIFP